MKIGRLGFMSYHHVDPVLLSLLNAPADDEPYTDAERESDAEAMAALARGEGVSHEEMLREFGLACLDEYSDFEAPGR